MLTAVRVAALLCAALSAVDAFVPCAPALRSGGNVATARQRAATSLTMSGQQRRDKTETLNRGTTAMKAGGLHKAESECEDPAAAGDKLALEMFKRFDAYRASATKEAVDAEQAFARFDDFLKQTE
jgi:hypothetical protein